MLDTGSIAGWVDRLEWHETIGSTNDRARELAEAGAAHGFVVGAEAQSAGRGRRGRSWQATPGQGLTFSVVVRPDWPGARWGWLALGAGVAVCEALEDAGLAPAVKWPNDVLLEGRKAGGILVERIGDAAVIGIGLNVNEQDFPEDLSATSLSLVAGRPFSREQILEGILTRLMGVLGREVPEIARSVWARLAWRDEEIQTETGARGRIRGFGENGELKVATGDRLLSVTDADGIRACGSSR